MSLCSHQSQNKKTESSAVCFFKYIFKCFVHASWQNHVSWFQWGYFGVRVSQCRKPLIPNYFSYWLNYLVIDQNIWYHTKEISWGVLHVKLLVRLTGFGGRSVICSHPFVCSFLLLVLLHTAHIRHFIGPQQDTYLFVSLVFSALVYKNGCQQR